MAFDYEWANLYLTEYYDDLNEYLNRTNADEPVVGDLAQLHSSLAANQGPVRKIAEDVLGEAVPRFGGITGAVKDAFDMHRLLAEALVLIRKKSDMDEHWSPETTIDLDTDALHQWVWHAAEDLWASEHWGEAVAAALRVINAKMQEKVGRRDISEIDLVNQAWSQSDPQEGKARLRFGDPDDPQTYTSGNEGALALGQALYKLWRNPLAHLSGTMIRQRALEGLAAASAFATLVEDATVEEFDD